MPLNIKKSEIQTRIYAL